MSAILEAVDVLVDNESPCSPLSLEVAKGEIVGLLFPEGRPRAPLLRTLAGVDAPGGGRVRVPRRRRIVLATAGKPLVTALSSKPDLVVLDTDEQDTGRNVWERIAARRSHGTSFVVGTSSVDLAYRSDRVSLAEWDPLAVSRAASALSARMSRCVQEFLEVMDESRRRRSPALVAELLRLNHAGRDLLAEMRRLTRSSVRAREERERRRVAANLHDGVGQTLALAQLRLADARASTDGPVHAKLEACRSLIDDAIEEIRNVTFDLSPPVLYDLGLPAALEWLAEQMGKRHGLAIEVDAAAGTDVDPAVAPIVFRSIRELLVNVWKHAKVRTCKVTLRTRRARLEIAVEDAGPGLRAAESARTREGYGLFSVREQIEGMGGAVDIRSSPGRGTRVTMLVPRARA